MAKHIHIHLPKTQDSGWEENKHPRKDDGKFGSGSGGGKKSPADEHAEKKPEGKKPTKAELTKQAADEYKSASAGHGNYAKAAKLYEAAGNADKADAARALAKRYGHDAGNAPGEMQIETSRHKEKGGSPEGKEREGGPLKRGERVKLHSAHSEGDDQEFEVVGGEEKGGLDISPVKFEGTIKPREAVQGYMVQRAEKIDKPAGVDIVSKAEMLINAGDHAAALKHLSTYEPGESRARDAHVSKLMQTLRKK